MATYIVLVNFTQQGMATIKQGGDRLDAARRVFQSLGVEMKAWYLTMGRYDVIAVFEAPDDEAIAKAALTVGAVGNVRTETLRAFTEAQYRQLIAALP